MFLRKNRRTKNGKPHIYWSLVETIRTPRGPRQRIVGYLGDLNEAKEDLYQGLVKQLEGKPEQYNLFQPRSSSSPISVFPESIRVERIRDFGDAWMGAGLWKLLELDKFFSLRIEEGKEEIPWERIFWELILSKSTKTDSTGPWTYCSPTKRIWDII